MRGHSPLRGGEASTGGHRGTCCKRQHLALMLQPDRPLPTSLFTLFQGLSTSYPALLVIPLITACFVEGFKYLFQGLIPTPSKGFWVVPTYIGLIPTPSKGSDYTLHRVSAPGGQTLGHLPPSLPEPSLTVVGSITRLIVGLLSVSSGQALRYITPLALKPGLMPIPQMRTLKLRKMKALPKAPQFLKAALGED